MLIESQDLEEVSKYSRKKVKVICDYCGKEYEMIYKNYNRSVSGINKKNACSHCKTKKKSETTLSERQERYYSQILSICENKNYKLLSSKESMTRNTVYIDYECVLHGKHSMRISNFLGGKGCPECAKEYARKKYQFKPDKINYEIEKYGGKLLNIEEYKNNRTKNLRISCPECSKEFITSFRSFVQHGGQRCPTCSKSSESMGEKAIKEYLNLHNIKFEQEYWFSDCRDIKPLPFDFYLPDYNAIIEFDGSQHYYDKVGFSSGLEYIKKHDEIKNNYCKEHGIKLLRIPYWRIGKVGQIIDTEIISHKDIVWSHTKV